MKRLNSPEDDNVPVFIFVLLFVILVVSFLEFARLVPLLIKMDSTASMLFMILITLFVPPLGVFLISGCGVDFWINVLLTILGYLPGHIHAFYLLYVYYNRRRGVNPAADADAPGVYSDRIKRTKHT